MQPSLGRVLLVYDAGDVSLALPLLSALEDGIRCVYGRPTAPELSQNWRDSVRSRLAVVDIAVLIVSDNSLRSAACMWQLAEIADRRIPVVLLFAGAVPVSDLRSRLKFPNIDWEKSRPLPQIKESSADGLIQLVALWLADGPRRPFRRRPPTKRQIQEWVGSNALAPFIDGDQVAFRYDQSSASIGSADVSQRKLSLGELREKRLASLSQAITGFLKSEAAARSLARRDRVDCSIFAPGVVSSGKQFKVQALLHLKEDLEKAAQKALQTDAGAQRLATETLQLEIKRGAKVELLLECPDLRVQNPTKTIEWQGVPGAVSWNAICRGMEGTTVRPCVRVYIAGVPAGRLEFDLEVTESPDTSGRELDWKRARARAYRNAFLSYARADIERVSYFAEALECAGIALSFDVTSLEPGDAWVGWIEAAIPAADVFYLMWSHNASKSAWVSREFTLALDTNALNGAPDVVPLLLERPAPRPPPCLQHLHFSAKYVNLRIGERNPLFT